MTTLARAAETPLALWRAGVGALFLLAFVFEGLLSLVMGKEKAPRRKALRHGKNR